MSHVGLLTARLSICLWLKVFFVRPVQIQTRYHLLYDADRVAVHRLLELLLHQVVAVSKVAPEALPGDLAVL